MMEIRYTRHALSRMLERGIELSEVEAAIQSRTVVEEEERTSMNCPICKVGRLEAGFTVVTLTRGDATIVI